MYVFTKHPIKVGSKNLRQCNWLKQEYHRHDFFWKQILGARFSLETHSTSKGQAAAFTAEHSLIIYQTFLVH